MSLHQISHVIVLTKKGYARGIGKVQLLPIFTEISSAGDQVTHRFENSRSLIVHLSPGPGKAKNWRSTQSRYD